MANISNLETTVAALNAQLAETKAAEAKAIEKLKGFAAAVTAAVTAALEADNAADQASIDAATAAIAQASVEFGVSEDALGEASA